MAGNYESLAKLLKDSEASKQKDIEEYKEKIDQYSNVLPVNAPEALAKPAPKYKFFKTRGV